MGIIGAIFSVTKVPFYFSNPASSMKDYLVKLFRISRKPRVVSTRGGLKFEVETASDYLLIMDMSRNLYDAGGECVVDIGAHKGVFSIFMAKRAKKIFSFEPNQKNFGILKRNVELNKINNIFPFNKAVSNKEGKLKLYLSSSSLGHSAFIKTDNFELIDCTTLKGIFDKNKIKRCDFLKMDCEGAEFDIILNSSPTVLKNIYRMVIEVHPHDKLSYNHLADKLRDAGFEIKIKKIDGFYHIFAKNEKY